MEPESGIEQRSEVAEVVEEREASEREPKLGVFPQVGEAAGETGQGPDFARR